MMDEIYRRVVIERLTAFCKKSQQSWVRSQHPPTQWNLILLELLYSDKYNIFLIYKEIQNGAVAKSYMGKGFLIYEEMRIAQIFSHI